VKKMVLIALLLGGCAVPASRPAVETVAPAQLGLSAAPTPMIDGTWWKSFGDPQLDRVVEDALAGNPTLDAALARVRQAEAVLATRAADNGPDVTLDAQAQEARLSGRYTIPPPYAGTVRFVGTAAANLNWNLDLFGRQRAAIEGARAGAEVVAGVARRTIATRERSLRLVQSRERNKLGTRLDTTAAQTVLAQARTALTRAEGQRAVAANALAALAGRGPDYAATLRPVTMRFDAGLPVPAGVPADLLSRRADIAAALARIDEAAAGRQVARRAFYPNINLAALAGFQAVGIGNLFNLDAGTVGAGPALHLPIFDNGRLKADLAGATAALDLATADYNDRVIGAVREVADAVALVGNLGEQRARQREVLTGLAETNRLNNIRVASGLESRLGLIDTDVRQLDAELADANLAADQARQRVALVLALGGGFSSGAQQ
jgi:outer membrane protein TolC